MTTSADSLLKEISLMEQLLSRLPDQVLWADPLQWERTTEAERVSVHTSDLPDPTFDAATGIQTKRIRASFREATRLLFMASDAIKGAETALSKVVGPPVITPNRKGRSKRDINAAEFAETQAYSLKRKVADICKANGYDAIVKDGEVILKPKDTGKPKAK